MWNFRPTPWTSLGLGTWWGRREEVRVRVGVGVGVRIRVRVEVRVRVGAGVRVRVRVRARVRARARLRARVISAHIGTSRWSITASARATAACSAPPSLSNSVAGGHAWLVYFVEG